MNESPSGWVSLERPESGGGGGAGGGGGGAGHKKSPYVQLQVHDVMSAAPSPVT